MSMSARSDKVTRDSLLHDLQSVVRDCEELLHDGAVMVSAQSLADLHDAVVLVGTSLHHLKANGLLRL